AALDDPHFYDAFDAEHGPVASPVGPEDKFIAERQPFVAGLGGERFFSPAVLPRALLFAGVSAFAGACALWFIDFLFRALTPDTPPPAEPGGRWGAVQ